MALKIKLLVFLRKSQTCEEGGAHLRISLALWHCGVVIITTVQLHSTKPELRFCTGSNPTHDKLEICNAEDLWQQPRLEIRLNTFCWSTIPQKQFIIIIYWWTLKNLKISILKKWKKKLLEISLFSCVPKATIIWSTVPEIRS